MGTENERHRSGNAANQLIHELGDRLFPRSLAVGDFAHLEGDPAATVSIVVRGQLLVEACPIGAWAPTAVGVLGPGSLVGEEALSPDGARCASVRALSDSSLLVAFRDDLIDVMLASATARRLYFQLLGEAHRARLSEALANTAAKVDLRVARWLLHCADVFSLTANGSVTLLMRQDLIASLAGTRRPTANRALHDLCLAGVIELRRGCIVVPDRAGLRKWIVANTLDSWG